MATILLLKPTASMRPPRTPEAPLAARPSAEIIFFPGVRYERWTEATAPTKAKRKRKSRARTRIKRDRLTIVV